MIVGASLGALGTSRAQLHLHQILDAPELKARIMPGTEFNLNNPEKVSELEDNFKEFLVFVDITNQVISKANTNRKKAFAWEKD